MLLLKKMAKKYNLLDFLRLIYQWKEIIQAKNNMRRAEKNGCKTMGLEKRERGRVT